MNAATRPDDRRLVRLLRVDPCGRTYSDKMVHDLAAELRSGDLLVVNDAATLPASFSAHTVAGDAFELRLVSAGADPVHWWGVALGEGDWRTRTEERKAPPAFARFAEIELSGPNTIAPLQAQVVEISTISPRLIQIELLLPVDQVWARLYALGRPVQYSYLESDLELWDVQTIFAGRPWAFEMPSAARPLRAETLRSLRRAGIEIAFLTHAAGLSATGDLAIDAALPLPERYEIPAATIDAIHQTHARGGRVIAVGTTVVRALEGNRKSFGSLHSGVGVTDLHLDQNFEPAVVDGLITGMHAAGESHHQLLQAFADAELLAEVWHRAVEWGYRAHEFGDIGLFLCGNGQADGRVGAHGGDPRGGPGPVRRA